MRSNYIISSALSILCIFLMNSMFGLDLGRMRIAHPSGSGEIFHGGVYTYINPSTYTDVLMENHIRLMAQRGLTHQYVANYNNDITAAELIQWSRKYGNYISFQSNDYYYGTETPSQLATKAVSAASFMGSLWNSPEFLTCSVKEEPPDDQSFINGLFGYYDLINANFSSYGGTAPLYLLHNYALQRTSNMPFKPFMTGTDRTYVYQWRYEVPVAGNLGYLASPRQAFAVISNYLGDSAYIDSSCQWAAAVLLGAVEQSSRTKSSLELEFGSTAYQHWLTLSQYNNGEGNQGLKEDGNNILSWGPGFYMPPANCMSCQTWLAIARGYRAVFVYKCDPYSPYLDIMGPDFKGTNVLNEFSSVVRELQKFGWAINHMEYQPSAAYISYTDNPAFTIYSGSFTIPGYNGKIAVMVNADVATWSSNTPMYFTGTDVFRIDNYGNVKSSDYTAKTTVRSIAITNNVAGTPNMYDLETGVLIGSSSGSINVLPGKGKFIFIGSSSELDGIRAKCGMTTITAHSGLIPNRETIPGNIQMFYAVNPKISGTDYQLGYSDIALNRKYRLHVTARSSNGAQLGALPAYYANGTWNFFNIEHEDGACLWNTALTSTPTEFVSKDFTVSTGTTPRLYLYRSNSQGTIQIDDAWLENRSPIQEITAETTPNIQIYYAADPKISSTDYQLGYSDITLNRKYRLHVTARSSNGAQLGALPAYYANGTWNFFNIELVDGSCLWNTTLTSTPVKFVSKDFAVTTGTTPRFYLYRSNSQGTIQIDDAWLEDCNTHVEITTEWMNNTTHLVGNGETYQVYARARNYPYTNATFSVKIYEYNSSYTLLGIYDTTPAIDNETLTEQPTVFKGTFQKNNATAHHVKLKFIKSSGNGPVILESACVGKITP